MSFIGPSPAGAAASGETAAERPSDGGDENATDDHLLRPGMRSPWLRAAMTRAA